MNQTGRKYNMSESICPQCNRVNSAFASYCYYCLSRISQVDHPEMSYTLDEMKQNKRMEEWEHDHIENRNQTPKK